MHQRTANHMMRVSGVLSADQYHPTRKLFQIKQKQPAFWKLRQIHQKRIRKLLPSSLTQKCLGRGNSRRSRRTGRGGGVPDTGGPSCSMLVTELQARQVARPRTTLMSPGMNKVPQVG